MPWTSEIDPAARLICTRVAGALTYADAVAHRTKLAADARFDPTFHHLLDLRSVEHIELTRSQVTDLASHSILVAPCRQAIVAPADVIFGVFRMYDAHRSGHARHEDIAVCRSMDAARAHLGVEPSCSAG